MGALRIGVAGWDYPDWKGIVYPSSAARGFDKLAHLCRFVDVVEINASFYRLIDPRSAESWIRRTEDCPRLRFTAKVLRTLTHDEPEDLREKAARSLAGFKPLLDAGRLGAVLLQFPQSFHYTASARDRLRRTFEAMSGWPLVLEVRHASWDVDAAADWVREAGAGWCVVDQPSVGRSTAGPTARVTARIAYMRLHGRNVGDWFREEAGRDARYNYLYSREELATLAETVRVLASQAEEVFVVQNNHFRGKAVVNALQLKHLLSGELSEAPGSLVAAYPEIPEIVAASGGQRRLF